MKIEIKPIGIVRNKVIEPARHDWQTIPSEIVIYDEFAEMLDRIETFSHITVLFWLHRVTTQQRHIKKVHPRHDETLPLAGVFATHSPTRPNPIGSTTVRLLERHNNVLNVTGLDAINETPVLDIKPYIPPFAPEEIITLPDWVSHTEGD